jgi:parallel beta-helix repeat protein
VYSNGTGSVEGNGIQVVNAARDRNVFVEISGNVVFDNGGPTAPDGHGIFVQNVDHVVVKGNIVRNSRRSGIVLYNVTGGIVEGNYVFGNNRLATPEHSGIMLQHVTRLHLTGNFLSDDEASPTQAYGLFFSGVTPSDRLWVTNNVLYPNRHGPWHGHVPPTNTVFIGNRTADTTQLAVGPPAVTAQLEITATTSRPSDASAPTPTGPGQPALYLEVKYGGKAYKVPLYNP